MKFEEIPKEKWPFQDCRVEKAYRNENFIVQIVMCPTGKRLTIAKIPIKKPTNFQKAQWQGGITWDELFVIKNSLGFAEKWCVECHPPVDKLVNVANMRHLWVLDKEPEFGFKHSELPP